MSKKILALILAVALLATAMVIPMAISADDGEIEIWDGSVASSFAGGTGTKEDPYIITNGAQLAFAIQYNTADTSKYNKYFSLANDIYLNDITKINWETGEVEEGCEINPWIHNKCSDGNSGWFYGNGHSVYGLYINEPNNGANKRVGLVPLTWNGVKFYDFGMDYTYINTQGPASFFIGYGKSTGSTYTEFENCWVGKNSTLISAGSASGFIYGQFKYATFKDCYSLASISGGAESKNGAFAADVWGPSTFWFKNCYGLGAFARNYTPTYTDCYSTAQSATGLAQVEAANMVGTKAQTYMTGLGADFAVTDSYPVFKTQIGMNSAIWGGFTSPPSATDGEYQISTPEQMAWYVKNGGKAKLLNDLYLNDLSVAIVDGAPVLTKASDGSAIDPANNTLLEWFGIDAPLGNTNTLVYNFNGNGKVINGLYYNQPTAGSGTGSYAGIFNLVDKGSTIYGVGIENAYMVSNATWAAALLIGRADGKTITVDSCYTGANTYHKGKDVAGICGGGGTPSTPSTYKNVYSLTTLEGTGKKNGLVADNWSGSAANFYNCYSAYYPVYRMGTSKVGVYGSVAAENLVGRGAQVTMPELGDAYVLTSKGAELKIFVDDVKESVWNGFVANEFAGGDGNEGNPYVIETGSQLARAIYKSAKDTYFKLGNDIYLNDLSKINWSNGTVTEGYTARSWYDDIAVEGNFDGDGHMVYGLYRYNNTSTNWGIGGTALFPKVKNTATINITGIGIDKAYICGWHGGAAFVGNGANDDTVDSYVNISECFVGEDVFIKGYDAGAAVGITRGMHVNVSDFYSLATLSAVSKTGISADLWGGSIYLTRVYNAKGSLDTKGSANVTYGYATVAGVNAVVLTPDKMQGEIAKITMVGLGDKFVATEGYPVLKLFAENYNENDLLGKLPFEGSGIEADPYLIEDAEDLKNMLAIGGQDAYYELTNDIYVNDVNAVDWLTGTVNAGYTPETWFVSNDPDGMGYISNLGAKTEFSGTINGNGYAVHGIYYEYGNNSTLGGLVPFAKDVTFINLGIEDSFIGAGRFTGGFVGYGRTVNLRGCWVDDSTAVFGWDAGADYVTADNQIDPNYGGAKLCQGAIDHYVYAEDANGTYKKDGDSYVAIAEDEEYDGTRYSISDIVWKDNVHFTSSALGGLVGRYINGGTIENCYVTANVSAVDVKNFGQEGKGVTWAKPGKTGGAANGHMSGLWGDDWNATVTAIGCFSILRPHENINEGKTVFTNVYSLATNSPAGVTKVTLAVGDKGLDEMTGLDKNVWYAVKDSTDYPMLRIRGTVIGDADENGIGAELGDAAAVRKNIIGKETAMNSDFNRDGKANVLDMVALTVQADKNAAAKEEANAKLLATVYLSASGDDANDGSASAPVATLNKAVALVQDGGNVVVVGTVAATSTPKSDKTVTISGGTLDFSASSGVTFNSGLVFADGLTLKFVDGSNIYANGNKVVINEGVNVLGTMNAIFGGGYNTAVASTDLTVKAGNYNQIYGGGYNAHVLGDANLIVSGTVNKGLTLTASGASYVFGGGYKGDVYGNTNVVVSGKVNEPLDHTSHTAIAALFAGSNTGTVHGNTYATITENAEFNYIYGGGRGTSEVKGATNIDFNAYAMSIYGGSGTVYETNVTVNGGWVHQVFGGCEGSSMTGNTDVTIKGGTIDRRVVGGCYNNANREGFSMVYTSENYVTGNTTVTLYDEATYTLSGDDYGITALSRHKTNHEAENGTLVFENSTLQNKLKNKLGINWILGTLAPAADTQIVK